MLTWPRSAEANSSGLGQVILSKLDGQFSYGAHIFASGRIAHVSNCTDGSNDAFYNESDVWLVPSGAIAPNPPSIRPVELDGADGQLTSFINTSIGVTFDEELLALVNQDLSGPIDLVLDHCQDGKFDYGTDYLLRGSITVQQGATPNNEQIVLLNSVKQKFRDRAARCQQVRDAVIVLGAITTVLFAALAFLPGSPALILGIAAIVIPLMTTFVAYDADICRRSYNALYNDPPDPQFQQLAIMPEVQLPGTTSDDPLFAATSDFAVAVGYEGAVAEMLLHSLERYQGAQLEGRPDWQLVHARAMRQEIDLLQHLISRSDDAAADFGTAAAQDTRPLDGFAADLEAARNRIVRDGLTVDEQRSLLNFGLTDAQLNRVRPWLDEVSFDVSIAEVQAVVADFRASGPALSNELATLAAEVDAVIGRLATDRSVGDAGPIAEAGGPYTGSAGAPIALDGRASASPVKIIAYAWDLDADGTFDDATGATPQYIPNRAFEGVIGLKVTNRYGLESIDYAAINVGATNGAPVFTSLSDGPDNADVIVGESWSFAAAASDPENDTVQLDWLLDGVSVASGSGFLYAPTADDLGPHLLEVVASNPETTAGKTRHVWIFGASMPDADGDGWRSHLDCNDADAAINPGQTEVLGNGKDDDCNPKTTDTGGPPVVFFNPQGGGRNVALEEGGATIHSFSSQNNTSHTPKTMIDYGSSDPGWRTGNGKKTDEWVVVALAGNKTYQIDRVKLQPGSGNEGVKSFSVAVATAAEGPYTTVFTGTAALNGALEEYVLPEPVKAKYVKLNALTNQNSSGCCIAVKQFKVYASQEGERVVTFDNLTVDSDNDIVSWAWDFGDGTTSSEQQPTHTYPAESKTYNVSLTVTDRGNSVVSYALPYRVLLPPAASFTIAPAAPNEGIKATYTDTSTDPDGQGMIGIRTWYWSATSKTTLVGQSTSHVYNNSGEVVVKLQVVDRQEQVTTLEKVVTIANVPPTITRAPNQTIVWGQNIDMGMVIINDTSDSDRGALTCDWDFGDGATARVERCNSNTARVNHAYANPGSYTAKLTVSDPDGGTTTASTLVTVQKRESFTQAMNVRNVAGGKVEVTAKAFDRYTWQPLAGREVSFSAGPATTTATTDANGVATATLPRGAAVDKVGVSIAATSHYNASGMERLIEAPLGDIVFVVDESGSMGDDQEDLRLHLNTIAMQLAAKVDFQIGLVGFGAARGTHGTTINGQGHIHLPFSNDVGLIGREIANLRANGGFEAGFDGTRVAMSDAMGFRPNAGACEVLITDDKADVGSELPTTREQAVAALKSRNAVFFGIIAPGIPFAKDHYGMNAGSLAAETGGEVWNISDFRKNPQPVLDAITAKCLAYITRVDLSLNVSDGRETALAGEQLTYTLTISNSSTGLARDVALVDTLPNNASFVGASNGGTFANGKVSWPTFDLPAGQTATRTLTVKLNGGLAAGTQVVNAASVADDGQSGPDRNPADNSAADTTTIEGARNAAPVAEDQTVATDEDTAKPITLGATDADGDALTYTIVDQPEHGTLSGNGPNLTYTPAANYHGADSFSFTANDGTVDSNVATVRITIAAVNDAPVSDAGPDQNRTVGMVVTLDGSGSSDLDGDSLGFAWEQVGGPSTNLTDANAAAPRFTPAAAGSYTFKLTVSDGKASDDDSVSVTVEPLPNSAPVAEDQTVATDEDTAKPITLGATDADGDALTYTIVDQPEHGTISGNGPNLTYTPEANYHGADSFSFKANDGTVNSNVATVSISVNSVNDKPDAVDDNATVTEDSGANTIAVAANDSDADGDPLVVSAVTQGANGAVATTGGRNVTYTPNANFSGADTFTYTISDGNGGSDTATVEVTVTAVNEAPDAVNDAATVAGESSPRAVDVLANDTDGDGDTLRITAATQGASGGKVTVASNGTGLTYQPAPGFAGSDTFSYTISDGNGAEDTATVTITVTFTVPSCNGKAATIYVKHGKIVGGPDNGKTYAGTLRDSNANDVVVGTSGNDTIQAGNGDDTVCGRDGNDRITEANGNDWIDAGAGDDIVNDVDGNDTILGGAGNDQITDENGNDRIEGGDGNDTLAGGNGDDTLNGGAGNDTLTADNGNDTLNGGDGDDTLSGDTGNDRLNGGNGDDRLTGGTGVDRFDGGPGTDTATDFNASEGDTKTNIP